LNIKPSGICLITLHERTTVGHLKTELQMTELIRTLEEQKEEFKRAKLLATPIAGLLAWLIVGIGGIFLSVTGEVWVLFIATGSIVYLGMFVSKFNGREFP